MTNRNQPLTDDEIAALLDETASEALRRRVENNVDYQQQVEDARFEARLGNMLYRLDCPTLEELSNYYLGIMDTVSERNIKAHIDVCSACQTDILELEEFLKDSDGQAVDTREVVPIQPKVATIQRPRRQLVRGSSGLRGPLKTLTAEADDVSVALTIMEDKVGVQVNGQLVASPDSGGNWEAAIVELHLKGVREPRITTLDDMWQFRFQQVETSIVDMHLISTEGQVVLLENINLTEN